MPGLRGRVHHIDGSTSELIHRYTTMHEPGGVLPVGTKLADLHRAEHRPDSPVDVALVRLFG